MRLYATEFCFFLISVSYKLAWTSISSLLSQFSRDYGPEVLLQLNIAYFLPSIPVLCLQTIFNDRMDRRLGLPLAAMLRFTAGLGGLALLTSFFPMMATSHAGLLGTTVLIGMAYGLAFGTSYQLASKFSPASTVALTTGFVSSGPVVLLLDILIKQQGTFYSPEGLATLFSWVAMITCAGLLAACWVVLGNLKLLRLGSQAHHVELRLPGKGWMGSGMTTKKHGVSRRGGADGSGGGHLSVSLESMESGETAPSNPLDHRNGGSLSPGGGFRSGGSYDDHDDKQNKRDLPLRMLALRVSPAAFAIFLSVGSSMLVFPFFTYVHSTGLLGERLPQVLFYVRLVGDIMGRLAPSTWLISTSPKLLLWGVAKTAMLPLLFLSVFRPHLCLGDAGALVLIGGFWVLSGYLNTCAYLLAPKLVPSNQKARASGIMTVAFQSSCFAALILAGMVQGWLVV